MSNGYYAADYIAWLLCHNYGFWPEAETKYEHNTSDGDIQSHFFANSSNIIKILIQYDVDELEQQD